MIDVNAILFVAGTVFSAGAAFGGAKVALNGTKQRVLDMKAELAAHVVKDVELQTDTTDRLARIETKLDIILHK